MGAVFVSLKVFLLHINSKESVFVFLSAAASSLSTVNHCQLTSTVSSFKSSQIFLLKYGVKQDSDKIKW